MLLHNFTPDFLKSFYEPCAGFPVAIANTVAAALTKVRIWWLLASCYFLLGFSLNLMGPKIGIVW